jgi:hypothetical protein
MLIFYGGVMTCFALSLVFSRVVSCSYSPLPSLLQGQEKAETPGVP